MLVCPATLWTRASDMKLGLRTMLRTFSFLNALQGLPVLDTFSWIGGNARFELKTDTRVSKRAF